MKQHTTLKQWNSLDIKQKETFLLNAGPWNKKEIRNGTWKRIEEIVRPDIGQMINFIGDRYSELLWQVKPNDVCDTLWKEVKTKLNE